MDFVRLSHAIQWIQQVLHCLMFENNNFFIDKSYNNIKTHNAFVGYLLVDLTHTEKETVHLLGTNLERWDFCLCN